MWLSLNHKYSNQKLELIELISSPEGKMYSILPEKNILYVKKRKLDELLEYTEKSKVYADMAVSKYPDIMEFFKLQAFIYRDIAIFSWMKNDNKTAETYHDLMGESVVALKLLYPEEETRDRYTSDCRSMTPSTHRRLMCPT